MSQLTVFAWFKHVKGDLEGLKQMPGLPKAARLPFKDYIADIQFSSSDMDYICGLALQFQDEEIAKEIADKIRRIAKDYDMGYEFKFCTEESKIDWIMMMGIEGKILYSPENPISFDVVSVIEDPTFSGWGTSEACDERDEILEDEPVSKFTIIMFFLMLAMFLVGAPLVGHMERSKAIHSEKVESHPVEQSIIEGGCVEAEIMKEKKDKY